MHDGTRCGWLFHRVLHVVKEGSSGASAVRILKFGANRRFKIFLCRKILFFAVI